MRILVADDFSVSRNHNEASPFLHRDDVDFLNLGPHLVAEFPAVPVPFAQVAAAIRSGAYAAAFVAKPTRLWNPRKALVRNLWHFARTAARGRSAFRLGPLLSLLQTAGIPVGGIDRSDRPILDNARFSILAASRVFFKRELPTNPANSFLYTSDKTEDTGNISRIAFFRENLAKLRPISLGIADAHFARLATAAPEKNIDVFFAGGVQNRPTRALGIQALQRLTDEGFRVIATDRKFSPAEYHDMAARALVCWSPEGFGFECYRTYEVAALGSVPLLKHPPILQHAPFRDGVNALFYTHEGVDLYEVLKSRLTDQAKLRQMGRLAREHVRTFHRASALADCMVRSLAEPDAACNELQPSRT